MKISIPIEVSRSTDCKAIAAAIRAVSSGRVPPYTSLIMTLRDITISVQGDMVYLMHGGSLGGTLCAAEELAAALDAADEQGQEKGDDQ